MVLKRHVPIIECQKELKDILLTVIVTIFDFLQTHPKVARRKVIIVRQNILGMTPKPFDAVDVVLGLFFDESSGLLHHLPLAARIGCSAIP